MRVTHSMLYRQTLASIGQQQAQALKLQDQLASGVRLTQAKDDPAGMARVLRNSDRLMVLDRQLQNVQGLDSRLRLIDSSLDGATDSLHRGRELLIAGTNAAQSPEALATLAIEMRALGEEMYRLANAADGQGRFLFAGAEDAAAPFSGGPTAALYQGGSTARQVPIDDQARMADGVAGDAVFLNGPAGDLFALFDDLATLLEAPTPTPASVAQRYADLDAGLSRLNDGLEHVLGTRVELGTNLQRLESIRDRIDEVEIEILADSASLRDTDFAAAISSLSLELSALEAARTTFTQIQGLSLFNFLR